MLGKRKLEQVRGHRHQVRFKAVAVAQSLQGAQVVPIAQFGEEGFLHLPVAIAAGRSKGMLELASNAILDPIVVQQRVIHVDQEDKWGCWRHGTTPVGAFVLITIY